MLQTAKRSIDKKDLILTVILAGALFAFCLWIQQYRDLPGFLGDELSYITPARAIVFGNSYPSIIGQYGSSLFYVPFVALISDPVDLYHALLFMQTVFIILNFFVLKTLVLEFFKTEKVTASVIAFAASMYPSVCFYNSFVLSECALLLFSNLGIFFLYRFVKTNSLRYGIPLGLCAIFLYFIHKRMLPLTGMACIVLLVCFFTRRTNGKVVWKENVKMILPILIVAVLYFLIPTTQTNEILLADRLADTASSNSLAAYLTKLSGAGVYIFLGSFGVGVCGIFYGIVYIWKNLRREKDPLFFTLLYLVAAYFALLLLLLLSFAELSPGVFRLDSIFYGRYTEFMLPLFICMGMYLLTRKERSEYFPRRNIYIAALAWFALSMLALYFLGGDLSRFTIYARYNVIAAYHFIESIYAVPPETLYPLTFLIGAGIFSAFFFLGNIRKKNAGLYLLASALCALGLFHIIPAVRHLHSLHRYEQNEYAVVQTAKTINGMEMGDYFVYYIDNDDCTDYIMNVVSSLYPYNAAYLQIEDWGVPDVTAAKEKPVYLVSSEALTSHIPLFGDTEMPFVWYSPLDIYSIPYAASHNATVSGLDRFNRAADSVKLSNLGYQNTGRYLAVDTLFSVRGGNIPSVLVNGLPAAYMGQNGYVLYYDISGIDFIDQIFLSKDGVNSLTINALYTLDNMDTPPDRYPLKYTVGDRVGFTADDRSFWNYCENGMPAKAGFVSFSEPWGTWANGNTIRLVFPLDEPPKSDLVLQIDSSVYATEYQSYQDYEFYVNGMPVSQQTLFPGDILQPIQIPEKYVEDGYIELVILNPTAVPLSEEIDSGIGITSLSFDPIQSRGD